MTICYIPNLFIRIRFCYGGYNMSELNGSVDLLANAMRKVFKEAMHGAVEPLSKQLTQTTHDIEGVERRLNANMADLKDEILTKIDKEGEEIRTGVYSQIAEQQKEIGQMKKSKSASPRP